MDQFGRKSKKNLTPLSPWSSFFPSLLPPTARHISDLFSFSWLFCKHYFKRANLDSIKVFSASGARGRAWILDIIILSSWEKSHSLWSVQCAVCNVQRLVFSVQCAVCSVQCAHCKLSNSNFVEPSVCSLCSVKCAVCSVQCAVCIAQF